MHGRCEEQVEAALVVVGVVALPRLAPNTCPVTAWPAGWTVTPLAETRPYAILRRGAVRISADADGLFRIIEPAP